MVDGSTLVGTLQLSETIDPESATKIASQITCILCGEDGVRQTGLEQNGDFRMEAVHSGSYLLVLEAPGWDVVIEDLVLGTESEDN